MDCIFDARCTNINFGKFRLNIFRSNIFFMPL